MIRFLEKEIASMRKLLIHLRSLLKNIKMLLLGDTVALRELFHCALLSAASGEEKHNSAELQAEWQGEGRVRARV
jgi:hypothetical protein